MAHFRAVIAGGRGEASRLGHKGTGIRTEAQTWDGKIVVSIEWDEAAQVNRFVVEGRSHGSAQWSRTIAVGTIGDKAETKTA